MMEQKTKMIFRKVLAGIRVRRGDDNDGLPGIVVTGEDGVETRFSVAKGARYLGVSYSAMEYVAVVSDKVDLQEWLETNLTRVSLKMKNNREKIYWRDLSAGETEADRVGTTMALYRSMTGGNNLKRANVTIGKVLQVWQRREISDAELMSGSSVKRIEMLRKYVQKKYERKQKRNREVKEKV